MRLSGRLVNVCDLSSARRGEMFALMEQHFANVKRATFEKDLGEKQWVIELVDPVADRLCGFSTQVVVECQVAQRPIVALFSGDTIVARDHWGDSALAHVWGRLALSLMDAYAGAELYWFLISKGYRTYRFLPVFFHEFYPRHDAATPVDARAVIAGLAGSIFPDRFDADAGVIQADAAHDRLLPGVADLSPERLCDPHVRFFVERNPGHAAGDELCCLAPLTRANFRPAAWRVIGASPACVTA